MYIYDYVLHVVHVHMYSSISALIRDTCTLDTHVLYIGKLHCRVFLLLVVDLFFALKLGEVLSMNPTSERLGKKSFINTMYCSTHMYMYMYSTCAYM